MSTTPPTQAASFGSQPPADVAVALAAARSGNEDAVLPALRGAKFSDEPKAELDEVYLQAELAYLDGRYGESTRRFVAFDDRSRRSQVPAWQRYGSAHRRMVAHYRNCEHLRARQALAEAEKIVAGNPELGFRQPNLDAMRGHFLELEGDPEAAKAS